MAVAFESCPRCGSTRIASIFYGLPDFESIQKDLDASRIVLGGCCVCEDDPGYRCLACGAEFGETNWKEVLIETAAKHDDEERRREAAAVSRGVMRAKVNRFGFVKCPHCHETFPITYTQFWDGVKHLPCKTRISLDESGYQPSS